MNHKRSILAIGLLSLAIILALWLLPVHKQTTGDVLTEKISEAASSPEPVSANSSNGDSSAAAASARELGQLEMERRAEERRQEVVERVINSLNTPISFYGRVVDQNGEPVADAEIIYNAADKFMESGSDYQGESDTNGYFTLSGVKGATLGVGVRKKGYYQIYGKSNAYFAYGVGVDSDRKAPPTKGDPAVFILQKMGETEPLIHISSRQFDIPRDGGFVAIDLAAGKTSPSEIYVSSWIGDTVQDRFDWRYEITVTGGGTIRAARSIYI